MFQNEISSRKEVVMARKKLERSDVWWLARGHNTRSRQPSFAPPTARPSVTHSSYGFGWHRKKACFITSRNHGMLSPTSTKEHQCDPEVAAGILRRCAYKNIMSRFFKDWYAREDKVDLFVSVGHMFAVSLDKSRDNLSGGFVPAEANLHFYSPENQVQYIGFHDGMTRSFAQTISGLKIAEIRSLMQ
jgi:hypothetical protein